MKVYFKSGSKNIKEADFPVALIRKKMEGIMQEHPHLCATCSSHSCGNSRGIKSDLVYSAIRTHDRDYVFGCIAYRKKSFQDEVKSNDSADKVYQPRTYSVIDPDVKELVRRMR